MNKQQLDDLMNFITFLNIEIVSDDNDGAYRIEVWDNAVYGATKGEVYAKAVELYVRENDWLV